MKWAEKFKMNERLPCCVYKIPSLLLKEYFFEKSSVTLERHMFICTKVSSSRDISTKAAVRAFTEKIPKRNETNSVPSVDVK